MKSVLIAVAMFIAAGTCSAQVALLPRHMVTPVYPPIGKTAHVTGKVVLLVTIQADGRVSKVDVTSGPPLLQKNAVENVKLWVFDRPAAAPFTQTIVYNFQYGDDAFQKSCNLEWEVKVSYDLPEQVNLISCDGPVDTSATSKPR
jgi:TonB family protein